MKHSGPFHSDDDGMQHEGHLCQLTRERSFLQPEAGMRMTAVHPAHEDCPMPCSALHTLLLLRSVLTAPFQAGITMGCEEAELPA